MEEFVCNRPAGLIPVPKPPKPPRPPQMRPEPVRKLRAPRLPKATVDKHGRLSVPSGNEDEAAENAKDAAAKKAARKAARQYDNHQRYVESPVGRLGTRTVYDMQEQRANRNEDSMNVNNAYIPGFSGAENFEVDDLVELERRLCPSGLAGFGPPGEPRRFRDVMADLEEMYPGRREEDDEWEDDDEYGENAEYEENEGVQNSAASAAKKIVARLKSGTADPVSVGVSLQYGWARANANAKAGHPGAAKQAAYFNAVLKGVHKGMKAQNEDFDENAEYNVFDTIRARQTAGTAKLKTDLGKQRETQKAAQAASYAKFQKDQAARQAAAKLKPTGLVSQLHLPKAGAAKNEYAVDNRGRVVRLLARRQQRGSRYPVPQVVQDQGALSAAAEAARRHQSEIQPVTTAAMGDSMVGVRMPYAGNEYEENDSTECAAFEPGSASHKSCMARQAFEKSSEPVELPKSSKGYGRDAQRSRTIDKPSGQKMHKVALEGQGKFFATTRELKKLKTLDDMREKGGGMLCGKGGCIHVTKGRPKLYYSGQTKNEETHNKFGIPTREGLPNPALINKDVKRVHTGIHPQQSRRGLLGLKNVKVRQNEEYKEIEMPKLNVHERQERAEIVANLAADADDRAAAVLHFGAKSTEELRGLAMLLFPADPRGLTLNTSDDYLPLPTMIGDMLAEAVGYGHEGINQCGYIANKVTRPGPKKDAPAKQGGGKQTVFVGKVSGPTDIGYGPGKSSHIAGLQNIPQWGQGSPKRPQGKPPTPPPSQQTRRDAPLDFGADNPVVFTSSQRARAEAERRAEEEAARRRVPGFQGSQNAEGEYGVVNQAYATNAEAPLDAKDADEYGRPKAPPPAPETLPPEQAAKPVAPETGGFKPINGVAKNAAKEFKRRQDDIPDRRMGEGPQGHGQYKESQAEFAARARAQQQARGEAQAPPRPSSGGAVERRKEYEKSKDASLPGYGTARQVSPPNVQGQPGTRNARKAKKVNPKGHLSDKQMLWDSVTRQVLAREVARSSPGGVDAGMQARAQADMLGQIHRGTRNARKRPALVSPAHIDAARTVASPRGHLDNPRMREHDAAAQAAAVRGMTSGPRATPEQLREAQEQARQHQRYAGQAGERHPAGLRREIPDEQPSEARNAKQVTPEYREWRAKAHKAAKEEKRLIKLLESSKGVNPRKYDAAGRKVQELYSNVPPKYAAKNDDVDNAAPKKAVNPDYKAWAFYMHQAQRDLKKASKKGPSHKGETGWWEEKINEYNQKKPPKYIGQNEDFGYASNEAAELYHPCMVTNAISQPRLVELETSQEDMLPPPPGLFD